VTRERFEHAIRAAGAVLGVSELLMIGSQAEYGSMSSLLPIDAARSVEVDVAVRGDVEGRLADLIDGCIGEASMFHDTFGYYHKAWRNPPRSSRPVGRRVSSRSTRRQRAA